MELFKTPFSRAYWQCALRDFRKPRTLVFSALMVAACVALGYLKSVPVVNNIRVTWGFLARAVCGMVGGPVTALVFGAAEDTINYMIAPSGPYFPGYMLTTMIGTFLYALFLYRMRDTRPHKLLVRVFLAKLCTNILNVVLGSLWSAILYSKGYYYYMVKSFWKNLVMLPVQTAMLYFLLLALIPILQRMGLIPRGERRN